MEKNAEFVDEHIIALKMALQTSMDKRKDKVSKCHKKVFYLKAYSRWENPKFEGIHVLVKQARKDGKRTFFSTTEPDKLYIDGRYVKL